MKLIYWLSRALFFLGWMILMAMQSQAQITVVVNKVPVNTPPSDTLYITGAFNNWTPGDRLYKLKKQPDGTFSITLPKENKPFEFKITRGTWANVEGDVHGGQLGNRIVHAFKKLPHIEYVQILSWEDLSRIYSWDIVVQKVPASTPFDAHIYVSGSFNDWKESDPDYRLTRLEDGTYAIKISKNASDTITYKFNRGNWKAAECRDDGRVLHNRQSVWNEGQTITPVYVDIEAWDDLGGGRNLFLIIFLSMAAFQGLVLILGLLVNKTANTGSTRALVVLTAITALAVGARLAMYHSQVFKFEPKLYLVSDLVYVLYAPAMYWLLRNIMGISSMRRGVMIFFGAGILALLAIYLPLLVIPGEAFTQAVLNGRFALIFRVSAGLASIYNLVGFVFCIRLLNPGNSSSLLDEQYREARLSAIVLLGMCGFMLLIWLFADALYGVSAFFHYGTLGVIEAIMDFLWCTLAFSIYVHTFMYLRFTAIFKIEEVPVADQNIQPHHKEDLEGLKQQLDLLMDKSKPYLNSKLTLEELAERMHINLHTLSWLINEGYGKNFFDFINEYRIEEFIRLSGLEKFRSYTFLALALEAGFNSKTTFNRVFKKHTGKTPREYFGIQQGNSLKEG